MKRRILAVILIIALLLSLAACEKNPTFSTSTTTEPADSQQTKAGNEETKNTDPASPTEPIYTDPTEPTEPAVDPRKAQCQYVPAAITHYFTQSDYLFVVLSVFVLMIVSFIPSLVILYKRKDNILID